MSATKRIVVGTVKINRKTGNVNRETQSELSPARGSTAARSMSQVMCEIARIVNRGRVKGVIGYAIRWETSAGSDMQMQWGQLKRKLP